jgi:FAD-linked oxidoreductase
MGGTWQNWGRSETVRPRLVERPPSVEAVQRAIEAAGRSGMRVKPMGAGHSFSGIAVAPDVLLELDDLSGVVSIDRERRRVRLLAGTRLHQIPRLLAPHGLAMQNLGDIDRQSISGAISTGTHGTGSRFGGIATQVIGATLVTASGDLLTVDETHNAELLPAIAPGLGALGVLVDVTLQCVPAFVMHAVDRAERLADVLEALDERATTADHFEFYWFPHTDLAITKTSMRLPGDAAKHPLPPVGQWIDDVLIGSGLHRVACDVGHVVPAAVPLINRISTRLWGDREFTDLSTNVFTTRRTVRFREMEYALPAENVRPAFEAMRALIHERGWRIEFPVEVRFAAADDLWMSTAYGRPSGYIAVHRYWRENPAEYFEAVEQVMLSFGGRPHWGKMHTLDAAILRERYARFDDFVALRDRLDPDRRFQNDYLARVLGE